MEKLTHKLLLELKEKGFTILKSEEIASHQSPTYVPLKIDDLWSYVESLDGEVGCLVIQDALANISDDDLRGSVILE